MNSQALKRPARILCVEDDPAIGEMLLQLFAREGYWVAHCADGQTAWNRLAPDLADYHVIVTDNQMPRWDGLRLVAHLREAGYPGRIIVHSSRMAPQQEANYRALGVDDFINKGASVQELMRIIARAVGMSGRSLLP